MRMDISPETVPETEAPSTRSQIRKYTMLTPLKMMNKQLKDSEKKELIPPVKRNMYFNPEGFNP